MTNTTSDNTDYDKQVNSRLNTVTMRVLMLLYNIT